MDGTKWTMKKILNDNYKCEGQMNIFDFIDKPKDEEAKAAAPVEDFMNPPEEAAKAADHKAHKADVDALLMEKHTEIEKIPFCEHSKHSCNKKELWKVADTLDELQCPHVCCRMCNTRNCGARCNGSEEPRELDPDFPIRDKEGWKPINERPSRKCIQLELQVLGKYRYNNKENWSLCPAEYDGDKIIPLEVPFDIPRPDWKYWRVRPDKGISHDRYGREYKAPTWMDVERCENCKWWQILPPEEQPPAGWGVKGQCNCYHEPEMMKNGYWKTSKTSSCQDFEKKEIANG